VFKRPELPRGFPVSGHFVLFHPPFSSLSSPRMRHPRTEGSLTKPISPKIRPSGCRAIIVIFFMAITPSLCPLARLSPNNSDSNGCAIQKAKCDPRIFQEIQNLLVVGKGKLVSGGVLKKIRGSIKRDNNFVSHSGRKIAGNPRGEQGGVALYSPSFSPESVSLFFTE
jgi:hypothetical protein